MFLPQIEKSATHMNVARETMPDKTCAENSRNGPPHQSMNPLGGTTIPRALQLEALDWVKLDGTRNQVRLSRAHAEGNGESSSSV
jgi:hypothetical protein